MHRFLLSRLLQGIVVLGIVSVVTFGLVQLSPGGLSILVDPDLDPIQAQRIARNLGLDRPVTEQYWYWLRNAATGDFGHSFQYLRPVSGMIFDRLPNTLLLAGTALSFALIVAVPAGMLAAVHHNSSYDRMITVVSFVGFSIPSFWLGIVLILVFSVNLGWLPASGMYTVGARFDLLDRLGHLLLPMLVIAASPMAEIMRYMRSSMLEILHQDYLRSARAKGLGEQRVLARHALRNAVIPVLTICGLIIPRAVGGSAIIEAVFGWPGIGQLAIQAAYHRDFPVIMGVTILVATVVVLSSFLVDLLYGVVDPRIRIE